MAGHWVSELYAPARTLSHVLLDDVTALRRQQDAQLGAAVVIEPLVDYRAMMERPAVPMREALFAESESAAAAPLAESEFVTLEDIQRVGRSLMRQCD